MNKIRRSFLLPLSLIVFLVLGSLGVILGQLFQDLHLDQVSERLEMETNLVAMNLIEQDVNDERATQDYIQTLADKLDVRLTVFDQQGEVIADSLKSFDEIDHFDEQLDLQSMIETTEADGAQVSDLMNDELLYHALPLEDGDTEIGYITLGIEVDEVSRVYQSIWTLIIGSFAMAFVVILVLTVKVTNQLTAPLEDAIKSAKQLARGNFKVRSNEGKGDLVGELNRSLNTLAKNLLQITKTYQIQQENMETLIENLESGVLLINAKGDITIVNKTCDDIFQEDTSRWLNQLYYKVIDHKEVNKMIQNVFLTEERSQKQIQLPVHIEIHHFDVYGAPIISNNGKLKGIVLVFHDITELKKLEQTRKDFVANVSHELKTPVTSLKGFTETLLSGAMDDEKTRKQFLTIISKESQRLENLIDDLLELSRIEQNRFQLRWQQTNLEPVIDDVLTMLEERAENKQITIHKHVHANATLEADASRLKQIIINLVNNSLMYTHEGGDVWIRVNEQGEQVVLVVEDTGIGMNQSEIPRVFERFYRVDRARSRNSGGTGLGLAIVKHLVEAHGAHIEVESEVGGGTSFKIFFHKKRQLEGECE
ncbi:two-component system histidine kinase PnpS [Texcoconibacillus texcoconensis]|uniref:histidine kinase n=1 Tax=Texcoconibacillus texcoconensis TaxID=1095777 RepID=A0A840QMX5_9BACI|nr:ATP-binding protein [Texcoconibacillus texcoconensis]MBB5172716.1 two-component system phosphate regulon sensor histidine kinase PhoR [Texcoconibacillus texcoconensis]